jgi:hypothetical protein
MTARDITLAYGWDGRKSCKDYGHVVIELSLALYRWWWLLNKDCCPCLHKSSKVDNQQVCCCRHRTHGWTVHGLTILRMAVTLLLLNHYSFIFLWWFPAERSFFRGGCFCTGRLVCWSAGLFVQFPLSTQPILSWSPMNGQWWSPWNLHDSTSSNDLWLTMVLLKGKYLTSSIAKDTSWLLFFNCYQGLYTQWSKNTPPWCWKWWS